MRKCLIISDDSDFISESETALKNESVKTAFYKHNLHENSEIVTSKYHINNADFIIFDTDSISAKTYFDITYAFLQDKIIFSVGNTWGFVCYWGIYEIPSYYCETISEAIEIIREKGINL